MTLGHIAGLPLEEWLGPLAVSSSGIAIAFRHLLRLATGEARDRSTCGNPEALVIEGEVVA